MLSDNTERQNSYTVMECMYLLQIKNTYIQGAEFSLCRAYVTAVTCRVTSHKTELI